MKLRRIPRAMVAVLLVMGGLAACAPAATSVPLTPGTREAKTVTLQVTQNSKLGTFLADGEGRPLYMFTKDGQGTSRCYDKCEQAWPPLLAVGVPILKAGIQTKLIGTTQRKNGDLQITYNGSPLYYSHADQTSGEADGHGIGHGWYLMAPDGKVIKGELDGIR